MTYRELMTGTAVVRLKPLQRLQLLLTGELHFACRHALEKPLDGPPGPSAVEVRTRWPLRGPLRGETPDPLRVPRGDTVATA